MSGMLYCRNVREKVYFVMRNLKIFYDGGQVFLFCGFIFDLFCVYLVDKDNFFNIVSVWEIWCLQRKKEDCVG